MMSTVGAASSEAPDTASAPVLASVVGRQGPLGLIGGASVAVDLRHVQALANCFPMIPSGKAHNDMLYGADISEEEIAKAIGKEGKMLV
jgi:hypothetical protein